MWQYLLLGLAGAIGIGVVLNFVINGIIDKKSVQKEMTTAKRNRFLVEAIERCNNQIKVKDMDTGESGVVKGNGIGNDIYQGQIIYAG